MLVLVLFLQILSMMFVLRMLLILLDIPTGLTANADHIGVFEQDGSIDVTITGPDESYQVGIFN